MDLELNDNLYIKNLNIQLKKIETSFSKGLSSEPDLNNFLDSGFYAIHASNQTTNKPSTIDGILTVFKVANNVRLQQYYTWELSHIYYRIYWYGTWQSWKTLK